MKEQQGYYCEVTICSCKAQAFKNTGETFLLRYRNINYRGETFLTSLQLGSRLHSGKLPFFSLFKGIRLKNIDKRLLLEV
jgi:hypothetical protein